MTCNLEEATELFTRIMLIPLNNANSVAAQVHGKFLMFLTIPLFNLYEITTDGCNIVGISLSNTGKHEEEGA